jgi:NAD(P)-dependent dehydrogenase (short-subunit alcohol dehydrogenase family)
MSNLGKWSTTDDVINNFSEESAQLRGKTIIITGCNTGIGKETVRVIASLGANVIMACRSMEKADAAANAILKNASSDFGTIHCIQLDLSVLESVANFVAEFRRLSDSNNWPPLSILILNGGIYSFGDMQLTVDGYESVFATNHLGHFHLTSLLLPDLRKTAKTRVVVVSSGSHYGHKASKSMINKEEIMRHVVNPAPSDFNGSDAYGSSKLCNALFATALNARESRVDGGIAACSLHPGSMIATDIARNSFVADVFMKYVMSWFTKSINQGASTTLYCCLVPWEVLQGKYYSDCVATEPSAVVKNEVAQRVLWELSEELVRGGGNKQQK